MKSPLIVLLCFFSLFAYAQDKNAVSYSKDLYPIVKSKCLKCHEKDDENPNNYAMDNVALLKSTGKAKNMVVSGDGANSYLVVKLLPKPPKGAQMPIFSKKKLTDEEVDLFKRWIDQGAKDN